VDKFGWFLLALAAPSAALAANPSAGSAETPAQAPQAAAEAEAPEAAERQERLICRRSDLTGQRTASRRVCRTAAQWREIDR
jgi:hypothetical protein